MISMSTSPATSAQPWTLTVPAGERMSAVMVPVDASTCAVEVGDDASVDVVLLPEQKVECIARVGKGAELRWYVLTSGNATCSMENEVVGEGGRSSVFWSTRAVNSEQQQLTVRNTFNAARGGGEIVLRAIAKEK